MERIPPTPDGIARAAEAVRSGEVIAYPTETVYGLGVDPRNAAALERLFAVKARDPNLPVLLIAANREQVEAITGPLSERAGRLREAFWPGPLSMVLPCRAELPTALRGDGGKVCMRWTPHPVARALCEAFGGALVSTSANRSGAPPARSADAIGLEGVALCLDGGDLEEDARPSTVMDPETRRIFREGAVSAEALNRVLSGVEQAADRGHA